MSEKVKPELIRVVICSPLYEKDLEVSYDGSVLGRVSSSYYDPTDQYDRIRAVKELRKDK